MAKSRPRQTKAQKRSSPSLTGAFFCEKVIEEKDGVPSYLHVVDVLTVPEPPPEAVSEKDGVPILPATLITIVIMFKSGEVKGKRTVRISAITPSGKHTEGMGAEVTFAGGETGATLRGPVPVPINEQGLFWFEGIRSQTGNSLHEYRFVSRTRSRPQIPHLRPRSLCVVKPSRVAVRPRHQTVFAHRINLNLANGCGKRGQCLAKISLRPMAVGILGQPKFNAVDQFAKFGRTPFVNAPGLRRRTTREKARKDNFTSQVLGQFGPDTGFGED